MATFLIVGSTKIRKSRSMKAEEIGELEILVNKLKFNAGQKASDLHDLIEDRLLADFEEIPAYAEDAYAACKAWSIKNKELLAAKQNPGNS